MGLFALPLGETWEQNVAEAEANLRLLHEDGMAVRSVYLIDFAIRCLQEAKRKAIPLPSSTSPVEE